MIEHRNKLIKSKMEGNIKGIIEILLSLRVNALQISPELRKNLVYELVRNDIFLMKTSIKNQFINELLEIQKSDVQESFNEASEISKSLEKHISKYFQSLGGNPPASGLYQIILKEVEAPLISLTLSLCHGNQIKAAKLLGINRNTLRKKIKELDILVTRGKKMM